MPRLKVALTIVMAVSILATMLVSIEVMEYGLKAGLLAFMAAATFLVGQVPTPSSTGARLTAFVQLVAGAAAVMSALNWIASEAAAKEHIVVVALAYLTAGVVVVVMISLAIQSFGSPRTAGQQEGDQEG